MSLMSASWTVSSSRVLLSDIVALPDALVQSNRVAGVDAKNRGVGGKRIVGKNIVVQSSGEDKAKYYVFYPGLGYVQLARFT